jgi:hypothetical protein
MRPYIKIAMLICSIALSRPATMFGQDTAYTRVITQRAEKIVKPLGIQDQTKATAVRDLIVTQYRSLNKLQKMEDKEAAGRQLSQLHTQYLSGLAAQLTAQQVDQVKDGMTYGVLPLTYKTYMSMLPDLTEAQRTQIMAWLVEAREHAMDGFSSEEKHRWFGKYKGKINNYLAAAGYNMKEAETAWLKRTRDKK